MEANVPTGGKNAKSRDRLTPGSNRTAVNGAMYIETYTFPTTDELGESSKEWVFPDVDASGQPLESVRPAVRDENREEEFACRLETEIARSFEAGRARGLEEGCAAERAEQQGAHAAETARRSAQMARLTDEFAAERARYFEKVEHEVVKLALAVAARILRREAQMDPLLLLGAVRVALGQLNATSGVRLRVPAAEASLWREAAALLPGHVARPEVVGEEEMRLGDCALETDAGCVDLRVPAQLAEIERGFFDRTAASVPERPGEHS